MTDVEFGPLLGREHLREEPLRHARLFAESLQNRTVKSNFEGRAVDYTRDETACSQLTDRWWAEGKGTRS